MSTDKAVVFTDEQRGRAAEALYHRAWGDEEPEFRPKKRNWVRNLMDGRVTPLTPQRTIDLQCELNEALELLLGGPHTQFCRPTSDWQTRRSDWLARNSRAVTDPKKEGSGGE